ncbi:MOSC domain-containing protein [Cellulosimicrobium sp. Marseille-Q4280]|uniref:MOSC domain-containing protein n=1 Tax=Cellulosimicrobium sp. Marseille-Q4280 TaxID=2937992 RepID=UPI002041BD56|nr:MOSC domain-containing protein [Cellulosimicrobium sp. Marseille-Q4280]
MTEPPRVHSIHVAKARRLPTRTVPAVEAEEGRGLVGDRYHGSKHRHVTVQTLADLAAASAELGQEIDPGLTRRNVTLTHGDLPTKPGSFLTLGDVELQVLRIAAPCRLLDDWIAPGAMRSMHRRGGVVCRLLSSGTIRVGDEARWSAPADAAGSGQGTRR